jgi:hypothetical protein
MMPAPPPIPRLMPRNQDLPPPDRPRMLPSQLYHPYKGAPSTQY